MKKHIRATTEYILNTGLFSRVFNDNDFLPRILSEKLDNKKSINILYGETYDRYGTTIDSLKYYFLVSLIHKTFLERGYHVTSTVLVGDIASIRNKSVEDKSELLALADRHISFIKKLTSLYHLPLTIKKMSDLFKEEAFTSIFTNVQNFIANSVESQEALKKTILKNKIKQENETGYLYSIEEIVSILSYASPEALCIKVGPPREQYYDQVANIVEKNIGIPSPIGIYVSPTYPLGMNFDFFICNPEIEIYGLTPYKAGSNKLMNHRIILDNIRSVDIDSLISNSFVPRVNDLASPVKDICDIALLAKSFLQNIPFENVIYSDIESLKKETITLLHRYIIDLLDE